MLVSTSSDLWAPTQELVFGRSPLRRGWTLVREIRRWYGVGSDRKYDEANQVNGETRSVSEETDHSRRDEKSRRGSAGRLVKGTKRRKPPKATATTMWQNSSGTIKRGEHLPSGTDRAVGRTSVRRVEHILAERPEWRKFVQEEFVVYGGAQTGPERSGLRR